MLCIPFQSFKIKASAKMIKLLMDGITFAFDCPAHRETLALFLPVSSSLGLSFNTVTVSTTSGFPYCPPTFLLLYLFQLSLLSTEVMSQGVWAHNVGMMSDTMLQPEIEEEV